MPTETNPRLPAARSVDSPTARTPAVFRPDPAVSDDEKTLAELGPKYSPPPLADEPSPPEEGRPEWATTNLSPFAARLHARWCDCAWGGDVYEHGVDFEQLAAEERAYILAETGAATRAPVEAKVWAGTWGAFGAGIGLVATVSLLDAINVIPSIFPGSPAVAATVALLTPVAPAVASFIRAYLAAHTARPDLEVRR